MFLAALAKTADQWENSYLGDENLHARWCTKWATRDVRLRLLLKMQKEDEICLTRRHTSSLYSHKHPMVATTNQQTNGGDLG